MMSALGGLTTVGLLNITIRPIGACTSCYNKMSLKMRSIAVKLPRPFAILKQRRYVKHGTSLHIIASVTEQQRMYYDAFFTTRLYSHLLKTITIHMLLESDIVFV